GRGNRRDVRRSILPVRGRGNWLGDGDGYFVGAGAFVGLLGTVEGGDRVAVGAAGLHVPVRVDRGDCLRRPDSHQRTRAFAAVDRVFRHVLLGPRIPREPHPP